MRSALPKLQCRRLSLSNLQLGVANFKFDEEQERQYNRVYELGVANCRSTKGARRIIINHLLIYCFIIPVFLFSACQSKKEKVRVHIDRMEQSLFSIPVDSVAASVPRLQQRYGELFDLYNYRVIAIGSSEDPQYPERLKEFVTDSFMYDAYRKVTEKYPDLTDIEKGLGQGFSAYHEFFPGKVIPSVYTLTSGFNQTIIVTDTILAIALDRYLGRDEEMYLRLNLANYQRRLMEKEYIVSDCIRSWVSTEFPGEPVNNVLDNILYEGKVAWCLHELLPRVNDTIRFGYTADQLRWCKNNTRQMWTFLIENKMLYSTDYMMINKLTGPAPFCPYFTRESPGRAVVWLGYQIIRSYMKNNKVNMEELMSDNDYQKILAKAKFKP